MENFIDQVSAA
jgi:trimeric autotransporter adhesin